MAAWGAPTRRRGCVGCLLAFVGASRHWLLRWGVSVRPRRRRPPSFISTAPRRHGEGEREREGEAFNSRPQGIPARGHGGSGGGASGGRWDADRAWVGPAGQHTGTNRRGEADGAGAAARHMQQEEGPEVSSDAGKGNARWGFFFPRAFILFLSKRGIIYFDFDLERHYWRGRGRWWLALCSFVRWDFVLFLKLFVVFVSLRITWDLSCKYSFEAFLSATYAVGSF